MVKLLRFLTSQLGRDVIQHYLMSIFAKTVIFRAAKQELQLSYADIRKTVYAPLDYTCIEMARKVGEWSVRMSCERCQGECGLLSGVDELFVSNVPHS